MKVRVPSRQSSQLTSGIHIQFVFIVTPNIMNLVSFWCLILQTFKQMGSSLRARRRTKRSLITFSKKAIHARWRKTDCNRVSGTCKHK